jgi:YgiT-type zinc finger domain-containing protein
MGKPAFQKAEVKEIMKLDKIPKNKSGQPKEWGKTTFEYEENGIKIQIPNIFAWVCPETGEASFTPETVDELILTVSDLLESAKRAKERRSITTEYIITVA